VRRSARPVPASPGRAAGPRGAILKTLEPATIDDAAAVLGAAARINERVVIRGGGTKSDWTSVDIGTSEPDVLLSTARLNRVVAHRHGDLTATVEAGASVADVNRTLAEHRQWIPLDPPFADRATIGGVVATNDSGPRRHRYGAPRDLIIGVELARADGVIAKAGGIVVKNVAGYDLSRLATGSFGCLGLIATATFKLYPLTAASKTVIVDVPSTKIAAAVVAAVASSQLTPTAVEVQSPPLRLLIRFESIEASVARQSAAAMELAADHGGRASLAGGDDERREWDAHDRHVWASGTAVAKVTFLPADLADVLDTIERNAGGGRVALAGRGVVGVLLVGVEGNVESQARLFESLRGRVPPGRGSVVLMRGSPDLKQRFDVWGPLGDGFRVMRAVKRSLDPQGVLNPGRGPGGL
jgi:glycolate oxidase FAD binding subunit